MYNVWCYNNRCSHLKHNAKEGTGWKLKGCTHAVPVIIQDIVQNNALKHTDTYTQVGSRTRDRISAKTYPRSWRSAHEQDIWMSVCSFKLSWNPAVHPNWVCLTCQHLNWLVKKRAAPSSSNPHPAFNSSRLHEGNPFMSFEVGAICFC